MTRADKLILGIVVLLAIGSFGYLQFRRLATPDPVEARVVVEVDGQVVDSFPLADLKAGQEYNVKGPLGYSVFTAGENKVRMVSSPCPDKVCIKRGWINSSGDAIVCVPNRVVIYIEGQVPEDGPDALTE